MDQATIGWTLSELAEIVGGELHGPADLRVTHPVPAGYDDRDGITFAESSKYLDAVENSSVGAVIVNLKEKTCTKPHIKCRAPREAFGRILALSARDLPLNEGMHPTAIVAPDADIDASACIGAYCVVEPGVIIGPDVKVFPFCYVGEGCQIGTGARLYPHVTLYRDVLLGERAIVHAGAVLGADGFGYFWDGDRNRKVPQVGSVRVGNDCEIGALTAIDRATAGETRIGEDTKLDNLVQIAHNVELGPHCIMASQSGISGSSKLGARVIMGGQCGVGDHVEIADDVGLGGRTGVARDIDEPGEYWGAPARESREQMRIFLLTGKLPQLFERLERLEKELEALRAKSE